MGKVRDRPGHLFVFPATVPLSQWQFIHSRPVVPHRDRTGGNNSSALPNAENDAIAAQLYQYQQGNVVLNVEMQYFINTKVDVSALIQERIDPSLSRSRLPIYYWKGIGFYAMFQNQKGSYLSACINPHGQSTVNDRQFYQNQNRFTVLSNRFLPWLLGREPLRDFRCLWTTFSISASLPDQEAFSTLEQAWST